MAALLPLVRGQPWLFLFLELAMKAKGSALGELEKRLKDYRITADACQIATVLMDLVKDKHSDDFAEWISQLAVDVLHEKTSN